MNTAYKNMRAFWLDTDNLKNKQGFTCLGDKKVCSCGIEMCMRDERGYLKNLFVAASVLGDSSFYFENYSASGLGGFLGGCEVGAQKEKALKMVEEAAKLAAQMKEVKEMPELTDPADIILFAVSEGNLFVQVMKEDEARSPENPFYPFFAYSQQLIGAFRVVDCMDGSCKEDNCSGK